ncbi:DUF4405 domain-containing protein [Candidatus Thiothrix sp. Deng01]|uniref:DUF4405 domain-containing protein n=1 Tax=Candidatus Thiothrix phosphatis TaxID=3112415 RepID=A0ABU6CXM3_9GAMM|nr:DUF4405 domain-containing protein [Candidatus Thiothrix sp. Deng01]MEB4591585.1 DUF4405 domain-containing protein [Candidatus Thiothrix sp. Deng01]
MDTTTLRRFATPLVIGSFMLMAVTGVMMFFHLEAGIIKAAHEWLSWIMVLAVGVHVSMHWRSFSRYFTQKPAVAVVGLFATVLVASMLIQGGGERRGPPGGQMQAARVLLNAPLNQLAGVTGKTVEALQGQLQQVGLNASDANTSLEDIARQNQRNPVEVLNSVLANQP